MASYSLHTDIDLARTKREISHCIAVWPETELVGISDWRDQGDELTAIVTFKYQGNVCRVEKAGLCCHRCNMRAIFLSLDAMRLMWKRGLGDLLSNTVAQMLALPGAKYIDPYELLGVRPDAPLEAAEAVYRMLAKKLHPDVEHGDAQRMVELNEAIEKVRADKKQEAA